jgi:hypothetical protein
MMATSHYGMDELPDGSEVFSGTIRKPRPNSPRGVNILTDHLGDHEATSGGTTGESTGGTGNNGNGNGNGSTGATGPSGPPGPSGPSGASGSSGPRGNITYVGQGSPNIANAKAGETYLDETTGVIYTFQ